MAKDNLSSTKRAEKTKNNKNLKKENANFLNTQKKIKHDPSDAPKKALKRVLVVCATNEIIGPTIAWFLSQKNYKMDTRSAGIDEKSQVKVTDELLMWADQIVCSQDSIQVHVRNKLMELKIDKPIVCLHIRENDSHSYRDDSLLRLIEKQYEEYSKLPSFEKDDWPFPN